MFAVRLILSLTVCLAAAAPVPAYAAPPGWVHSGYDAEDSYYNPGESAINAGTVGHLTRRWSAALRQTDGACGGPSTPLVSGGRVFATDQLGISAYQADGGQPAWHFDWADPVDASTALMAVAGGLLIAANSSCQSQSDPSGSLTAIDVTTGAVRWHVVTEEPIFTLAVDKGVAVISGVSPSDRQVTTAYRTTDSRLAWAKTDYASSGISADGRLLLTREFGPSDDGPPPSTDQGGTSVVSITTGVPLWSKPPTWYAQAASPAGDRFYVAAGSTLLAVDAANGAVVWNAAGKAGTFLAADGRRVYRSAGQAVEALDARTGHRRWARQLTVATGQPVRAGGLVYTGGPVLNAANGSVVTAGTPFTGTQIITGGRLLTVNGNILSSFAPQAANSAKITASSGATGRMTSGR